MNKLRGLFFFFFLYSVVGYAQNDLVIGTNYPLNIQHKNTFSDIFLIQNARYSGGVDSLQWETSNASFGLRGIRFNRGTGIHFYADNFSAVSGMTFLPTTRFFIGNDGEIGVGTIEPDGKIHILGGNLIIENGDTPAIITGTGPTELNRFLRLINSSSSPSPTGLKAGGLLVSDDFSFADPGKNDLVIKGRVGIGTTLASSSTYQLMVNGTLNTSGLYVNDQLFVSSPWTSSPGTINYDGVVGIGTSLANNPNNYTLAVNGKIGAKDFQVEKTSITWPDYVFEEEYPLPEISLVEAYVKENKHLPGVPTSQEIKESGYLLGEMDAILLQKIEELTLYVIQQQKELEELKRKLGR